MQKPNSPSCERNQEPILSVLKEIVTDSDKRLLEIGSGTGQHAVYFAPHFPHLKWVTSDVEENHAGIKMWQEESKLKNILGPLRFEVGKDKFPNGQFDLCFTANTFHIMPWKTTKTLIKLMGVHLEEGSQIIIYGPFNYNGTFTSDSNRQFDLWLKKQNPESGIRAFEDVKNAMLKHGFSFTRDYEMPANNRILLFTKVDMVTL